MKLVLQPKMITLNPAGIKLVRARVRESSKLRLSTDETEKLCRRLLSGKGPDLELEEESAVFSALLGMGLVCLDTNYPHQR